MTSTSALLNAPAATVPAHAATEIVGRLRTAIEAASRRWMARKQYRHLLACDEHLLQDIGVTRADVRRAMQGGGL